MSMDCCAINHNSGIVVQPDEPLFRVPLCYCFGFDESHLREEISKTGNTTVPERISRLIREGLCACDVLNPSGKCCLGEVNRTAIRLKKEALECADDGP